MVNSMFGTYINSIIRVTIFVFLSVISMCNTMDARNRDANYEYIRSTYDISPFQQYVKAKIIFKSIKVEDASIKVIVRIVPADYINKGRRKYFRNKIVKAALSYTFDDTLSYTSVQMNSLIDNTWEAKVPVEKRNRKLLFFITAVDDMGNIHTEIPKLLLQKDIVNSDKLIDNNYFDRKKTKYKRHAIQSYGVYANKDDKVSFYVITSDVPSLDDNSKNVSIGITNYDIVNEYLPNSDYLATIDANNQCAPNKNVPILLPLRNSFVAMKKNGRITMMIDENNLNVKIAAVCSDNVIVFMIDKNEFTPPFENRQMSVIIKQEEAGQINQSGIIGIKFISHDCNIDRNEISCVEN